MNRQQFRVFLKQEAEFFKYYSDFENDLVQHFHLLNISSLEKLKAEYLAFPKMVNELSTFPAFCQRYNLCCNFMEIFPEKRNGEFFSFLISWDSDFLFEHRIFTEKESDEELTNFFRRGLEIVEGMPIPVEIGDLELCFSFREEFLVNWRSKIFFLNTEHFPQLKYPSFIFQNADLFCHYLSQGFFPHEFLVLNILNLERNEEENEKTIPSPILIMGKKLLDINFPLLELAKSTADLFFQNRVKIIINNCQN